MTEKDSLNTNSSIIEVYEDNFVKEIKHLGEYLEEYPYIGMDTEFPGIVYPCQNQKPGFYYRYIKGNVDELKLIQFGITLCNSKGESPSEASTWQFNLRFNYKTDIHSVESIQMLSNCGINFDHLKKRGINYSTFAEYFFVSGLILNENVKWISFNGLSDFAYLLKLALNSNLPETEATFLKEIDTYFPHLYDIKVLVSGKDKLKGSLNRLAQLLDIERRGDSHQAGSDSAVTADVFFAFIKSEYFSLEEMNQRKNVLFGVGQGTDENETLLYTQFAMNGPSFNMPFNPYVNMSNASYHQNKHFNPSWSYCNQSLEQNQSQIPANPFTLLMAYSN